MKRKLLWGFHIRDDYSAERQQLVIGGVESRMFICRNFSSQTITGFQKADFEKLSTNSLLASKNTLIPYFLVDRASLTPHGALPTSGSFQTHCLISLAGRHFYPTLEWFCYSGLSTQNLCFSLKEPVNPNSFFLGNQLLMGACCEPLLSLWAICLHFLRVKLSDKQFQNSVTVKSL